MSSIFSNSWYSNIPRNAAYPYYNGHLGGLLPQTQYPYDGVYDNKYQQNIRDPSFKWYNNMEYPYYVQRHRIPQVFTEPKPDFKVKDGYFYSINNYPPYVYWYPNPLECRDACGEKVCNEYYRRLNNYNNCQRCQLSRGYNGMPMCFDSRTQKCVDCSPGQALANCEDTFGCGNPQSWPHGRVPPQNPLYTGCKNCV